jgi:hypothetical protein
VISEPTTTLTDYAMAIQSVIHAWALRRAVIDRGRPVLVAARLYLAGFVMVAIAALAGGTSHGFRMQLGDAWTHVWTLTVWSIASAAVLMTTAAIRSAVWPAILDPGSRTRGRRRLALGFGLTIIGLTLMVQRVSFHQHFNHNDLYHVVQMAGLFFIYRGARDVLGLPPAR